MPEYSLDAQGRRIGVWLSPWTGLERVTCDGQVVSQRRSFSIKSRHTFALADERSAANYEVEIGLPSGIIVRQDGTVVAQDRGMLRRISRILVTSGVLGLLTGFLVGYFARGG